MKQLKAHLSVSVNWRSTTSHGSTSPECLLKLSFDQWQVGIDEFFGVVRPYDGVGQGFAVPTACAHTQLVADVHICPAVMPSLKTFRPQGVLL